MLFFWGVLPTLLDLQLRYDAASGWLKSDSLKKGKLVIFYAFRVKNNRLLGLPCRDCIALSLTAAPLPLHLTYQ